MSFIESYISFIILKRAPSDFHVSISVETWTSSGSRSSVDSHLSEGRGLPSSEVHAGPAKFEFGDDEFVDWVDGQAMSWGRPRFVRAKASLEVKDVGSLFEHAETAAF